MSTKTNSPMERHIERLLMARKDWTFCMLVVEGRTPMWLDPATDITLHGTGDNQYLQIKAETGHPAPQSEAEEGKQFDLVSYIYIDAIQIVDFYKEKLILKA